MLVRSVDAFSALLDKMLPSSSGHHEHAQCFTELSRVEPLTEEEVRRPDVLPPRWNLLITGSDYERPSIIRTLWSDALGGRLSRTGQFLSDKLIDFQFIRVWFVGSDTPITALAYVTSYGRMDEKLMVTIGLPPVDPLLLSPSLTSPDRWPREAIQSMSSRLHGEILVGNGYGYRPTPLNSWKEVMDEDTPLWVDDPHKPSRIDGNVTFRQWFDGPLIHPSDLPDKERMFEVFAWGSRCFIEVIDQRYQLVYRWWICRGGQCVLLRKDQIDGCTSVMDWVFYRGLFQAVPQDVWWPVTELT